jgi:hypothetical protein
MEGTRGKIRGERNGKQETWQNLIWNLDQETQDHLAGIWQVLNWKNSA